MLQHPSTDWSLHVPEQSVSQRRFPANPRIVAGMVRKSAAVRWQGLALLCLAIGKAFFFDLSFLTTFYRIVSFFVLGLVLLAVSFFYQKRPKAHLKTTQP